MLKNKENESYVKIKPHSEICDDFEMRFLLYIDSSLLFFVDGLFHAAGFEKIAQHLGGFRGVVRYLCNAGAPQVTVCVKYARIGRYAAALFVCGGKVYVAHARKGYRRGAHCARFQ